MMDYAVESNEEIVSEFIVKTCQLLPKPVSLVSYGMHELAMSQKPAPIEYGITCGSSAEFYIRPLNTCITDVDLLLCRADELIFCGGFPVLPSDNSGLADKITCIRMEPYKDYPGFVRLQTFYELNYDWKYKMYECNLTFDPDYHLVLEMESLYTSGVQYHHALRRTTLPNVVSGPAIKSQTDSANYFASDNVKGVFCPQWPKEAENWPIRQRKFGWPTINTISEVVRNGCHVVYAQHRFCRDDKLQWRLSFSLAEVILIQSWTQTQQIVYHLLRFFAKRELIQKDCPKEDEVLCPYHLKTLMLWTCEAMPPEWWDSSSVIVICCDLLIKLSTWLLRRKIRNYFIPEANLLYEPSNFAVLHKIERRLEEFCNSEILSTWFVENYILPIARDELFQSSGIVVPHFEDYMSPILNSRKTMEKQSLNVFLMYICSDSDQVCRGALKYGLSAGWNKTLGEGYAAYFNSKMHNKMANLPTTEKVLCFKYYKILVYILHTVYGLRYGEISWESSLFVEFVKAIPMQTKIIRSKYHNFPKMYTKQSSRFQFLRAQSLMENLTGYNSRSEFQLISLVSKEFLRKALEYDAFESDGIDTAALSYLSALHFATSEYQQVMRCCSGILVGLTSPQNLETPNAKCVLLIGGIAYLADRHSQRNKETLNAGCLLFIDDIATIVGLCVLHKKITDTAFQYIGVVLYLDLRLSPEVFAHYLNELSAKRMCVHKRLDFAHDLPESAFPMDDYLKALMEIRCMVSMKPGTYFNAGRKIAYRRTDLLAETDFSSVNHLLVTEAVIDALMECALENMTSFYNAIRKDFGIQCNTNDCYRALHLYKCRHYNEVLHLCDRILHEPELQSDLKEFAFANVSMIPPLHLLFDGDVQSLLGFHTLFYYLSPLKDEMGKVVTVDSTFEHIFAYIVSSREKLPAIPSVWSKFFFTPYPIKCHYFLGRHFLARYLKARCCIDCNLPFKEVHVLNEFESQKTFLPFEHIILTFLLQKLRFIKKR